MNILKKIVQKIFTNAEGVRLNLHDARKYEDLQQYEDACYSYACAIGQGARDQTCKDKIKHLYKTYGPFTFEKQLERMKKEYCSCCESCGEGFHIGVVKDIKKIIEEN